MRSEIWIASLLFWGLVKVDSWEWEDDEETFPCIPVGYKCYTTNDCCSGATCVSAKWSSHLVCLVAGYKEDIKLDRIGRKKEVQPQDLEYLKNMYGFTVDYYGLAKESENTDGLSTLELFPETTNPGLPKDLENPDGRTTLEPLPETTPLGLLKDLENQEGRSMLELLPETTPPGLLKDLENPDGRSTLGPLPGTTPLGLLKDLENQERRSMLESLPEITPLGIQMNLKKQDGHSTAEPHPETSPLGLLKDLENQEGRSMLESLPEITPLGIQMDLKKQDGHSTAEPHPETTPLGLLKDLENPDGRPTLEPLPGTTPIGSLKDLENQEGRSMLEPLPGTTPLGLLKDLENQDGRSTVKQLPETTPLVLLKHLENQDKHSTIEPFIDTTPFPLGSVANLRLIGSRPITENNPRLSESVLALPKERTAAHFDLDELNNFKTFLDEFSGISDDFINKESSKYVPSKRSCGEESFKETKETVDEEYREVEAIPKSVRNKRSYGGEPFRDAKEDKSTVSEEYTETEESRYSESYVDPFGSYLDNTDRGTLIDNITSQIKPDSEFKPISYSSLEQLLQNLTGYEFYLPNFTWPFRYNETSTTPVEPVTISERLWNLSTRHNGTNDYPALDFGETYNILKGNNYSDDWLLGRTARDGFGDSINFNLTSLNKFVSSLSFGFFKDKNSQNVSISPSTWQKLLRFVRSEKKDSSKSDLNSTIAVLKENRSAWKILTDLFRSANETIQINLIPRNDSDSNGTDAVVDLINNFRNCGIASNISCLLMSILDSNGTKLTRFEGKDVRKDNARRLWRRVGDDVRQGDSNKSKRFEDVVTLVKKQRKSELGGWGKFKRLFQTNKVDQKSDVKTLVSENNDTRIVENKKWWSKFKHIFKKSDQQNLNVSKSEHFLNLEMLPDVLNISSENVDSLIDNSTVKLNLTDSSNLRNKIRNVVLFKTSKIEAATIPPEYSRTTSSFMRRYLEWSADHRRPNRIGSDASESGFHPVSDEPSVRLESAKNQSVGGTGNEEVDFWNRWKGYPGQATETSPKDEHDYGSYFDEGLLKDIDGDIF